MAARGPAGGWKTFLKLAVSAALIVWILRGTDLGAVRAAFRSADLRYILLAIALIPLGYLSSVMRWRLLLRAQGGDATVPFLLRSLMTGIFFNNLLPSTIGGDAIRAYDTARSGVGRGTAVTIVLVDRFVGLLALLVFAAVGLLGAGRLTEKVPALGWWVVGVGAVMVAIAVVLFGPAKRGQTRPASGRLSQALAALFAFRGHGRALAEAFFWSLCLQTLVVVNAWVQARALHVHLGLAPFFLIVPLSVFLMMIPVSINGIGVRENLFIFFLGAFGVAGATGLAFAWLEYGILLLQALAGGLVYAAGRERVTGAEPVAEGLAP